MLEKEIFSPDMLTTAGVARIFEVQPGTVSRWCRQGMLKSCRAGARGRRRFLKWDIAIAYLDRSIRQYIPGY